MKRGRSVVSAAALVAILVGAAVQGRRDRTAAREAEARKIDPEAAVLWLDCQSQLAKLYSGEFVLVGSSPVFNADGCRVFLAHYLCVTPDDPWQKDRKPKPMICAVPTKGIIGFYGIGHGPYAHLFSR